MCIVDWSGGTGISLEDLPAVITAYLAAHQARDVETAITAYSADAVVTDEGRTHRGWDEIRTWLDRSGSEYTYTTEFIGAARVDDAHFDVVQHLVGDFPGGVVDLHYRFTLNGALINRLTIEP
ncbi:nuclear transport factor 2 family protein [Micromonospora radicis]|uniref:Nuclear transport factor 2 family protein n=1 Tax=Micromonospora radicis TaxID=1894971 RepID=A0A418MUM4_9ACTN|nr:nuclear transport factor 2 family protein [Micromonospora radicis]RIV38046.1 nuclear transport factor 2 family protein [Micromonospora radicis]